MRGGGNAGPSQINPPTAMDNQASQADGSGVVVAGRPSKVALIDGIGSVAGAGGGTARHTRVSSVDAPTVVADCRRLRSRRARNRQQPRTAAISAGPRRTLGRAPWSFVQGADACGRPDKDEASL